MLRISKEFVTDNCSPKNPPVARCHSGDTVMFETRDCYDDRLRGGWMRAYDMENGEY